MTVFHNNRGFVRGLRGAFLVGALAMAMAGTPAMAQSAASAPMAPVSYNISSAIPPKFLAALQDSQSPGFKPTRITGIVDGQSREIVTQRIAWHGNGIDDGNFALDAGAGINPGQWKRLGMAAVAGWTEFANTLKAAAKREEGWSFLAVQYVTASDGSASLLSNPGLRGIDEGYRAFQQRIESLSQATGPGQYFTEALVPTDIAGVRREMIAYGNKERLTPNFRRLTGASVALDLNVAAPDTTTKIGGGTVFRQPDLVENAKLDDAAQFFAEALATGRGSVHSYTADGGMWKGKVMATMGDRVRELASDVPNCCAEVGAPADGGLPGHQPYLWITSDTHYKWFFGVDAQWDQIGFGAARNAAGKWFYVGVANSKPN